MNNKSIKDFAKITNVFYDEKQSSLTYYKFILTIKTSLNTSKRQVVYTHHFDIPKRFKKAMNDKT